MLRGAVKSHSVEVKQVNALPCALYWLFDVTVLVKASRLRLQLQTDALIDMQYITNKKHGTQISEL